MLYVWITGKGYPSYLVAAQAFSNSYLGTRVRGAKSPVAFTRALNSGGSYNSEQLSVPYNATLVGAIHTAGAVMQCS